jgi:hypothetical protein
MPPTPAAPHAHSSAATELLPCPAPPLTDEIWVTKGFVSKRPWFHGRGKVGLRTKFYSHLSVVLRPRQDFVPWMKAVDAMQVRERKQRKYPYATPGMLKAVRRKVLAEGSGTGATSA